MTLEDMLYDDEAGQPKRPLMGKRTGRYLPVSGSVKDDLQEIYELQKEIGVLAVNIHKLLGSLMTNVHEEQECIRKEIEVLTHAGAKFKEKMDELLKYAEDGSAVDGRVTEAWKPILVAVNAVLEANGYDPNTLARRDQETARILRGQEKRREMWVHAIISTFVGLLSTIGLWMYSKSLASNQVETNQSVVEVLKRLKKETPEHSMNDHVHPSNNTDAPKGK